MGELNLSRYFISATTGFFTKKPYKHVVSEECYTIWTFFVLAFVSALL